LQRKNEIEVLLSIIVKSINQYEASLLLEGTEDNPIIESLQDGLTSLIDFMKSYQDFLQAILNSGDPTKASPRDIVHAIGLFLDRLMNTVSDIDGIKLKLQQVRPALAEKVGQILQNFPNDAREIFKALTQICLINEEGGSMTSTEKAGEAEKNMIEALLSLKTNVEALGFLFRSDGLSAGKQTLEVLKQSVESLQFAIQINRYTLSDVQSDYAFRYELTKSSIESGWQVTRDFIVNKFPAIEGHFVLEKIENQKSVYDAAATMIIDGFNKLLDDFQLAYDKKLSEAVTSTQLAVTSTKQTILKLMKRNFERIAEVVACLQRDGFDERIRNVSDGFAAASKAVEGLVLNVTSLNVLANDYDSYVVKLARTVIKAEDNEQVDEDVEQVTLTNVPFA